MYTILTIWVLFFPVIVLINYPTISLFFRYCTYLTRHVVTKRCDVTLFISLFNAILNRKYVSFKLFVWWGRIKYYFSFFILVILIGQRVYTLKSKFFRCVGRKVTTTFDAHHRAFIFHR